MPQIGIKQWQCKTELTNAEHDYISAKIWILWLQIPRVDHTWITNICTIIELMLSVNLKHLTVSPSLIRLTINNPNKFVTGEKIWLFLCNDLIRIAVLIYFNIDDHDWCTKMSWLKGKINNWILKINQRWLWQWFLNLISNHQIQMLLCMVCEYPYGIHWVMICK